MLKLGSGTGSLINHIQSGMTGRPDPEVGMGVTFFHWTDRSAGTIVEVTQDKQGRKMIATTGDTATREDSNGPFTESQTYSFKSNPDAPRQWWRQEEDGSWVGVYKGDTGRWKKNKDKGIGIGRRDAYHDPCF